MEEWKGVYVFSSISFPEFQVTQLFFCIPDVFMSVCTQTYTHVYINLFRNNINTVWKK